MKKAVKLNDQDLKAVKPVKAGAKSTACKSTCSGSARAIKK